MDTHPGSIRVPSASFSVRRDCVAHENTGQGFIPLKICIEELKQNKKKVLLAFLLICEKGKCCLMRIPDSTDIDLNLSLE